MSTPFSWESVAAGHIDLLLENVEATVWAVDRDLRFRLSRGVVPRRGGLTHETVLGVHLRDYLEPEIGAEAEAKVLAAFEGERGSMTIRREGRELETLIAPLRLAGGEIAGAVGITVDVTEQRRPFHESQTRLALIVAQSPAFLWTTDSDLRVTELLGEAANADHLTPIGTTLRDFWGPSDTVGAVAAHERALAGESVEDESTTGGRTLASHLEPLRDSAGETIGVIGVALDVTAERALQRELLQAQKLDALGRLTGGIAHDFNNMLVGITGYLDLAKQRVDDEKTRGYLDGALEAAHRSAALIRQLLAFSRKQTLVPRLVDPNDEVRIAASLLGQVVGERVQLNLDLAEGLPAILVDPGQLEQVILNLVVNARDAMPGGGVVVLQTGRVDLTEPLDVEGGKLERGSWVQICVADSGTGIDPAVREQLFEPFFTTKDAGTGLGLATVLGIVKQSGGELRVESHPGEGSTFRIYFPVASG